MRFSAHLVFIALVASFTAVPARATFPGQNGKIIFVGNQSGTWQLYTINPDGSDMDQITNLPPTRFDFWAPVISPDGRRILFAHDTAESPCGPGVFPPSCVLDMYVSNADGSGRCN